MELTNKLQYYTGNLPDLQNIGEGDKVQRSKEWFEKRRGLFTGSKIKDLMTCDRSAAKKEWGRPEKLIAFGNGAYKYIYSRAMEIKHGKVIEKPDIFQFKYGRALEPVAVEILKRQAIIPALIEQDFLTVKGYEKYLGASPDGYIQDEKIGIEIKGAMDWETHYDRVVNVMDEKHTDFWQLQTEMLALGVDRLKYVIAHPAENAMEFIQSENIEEQIEMIGDVDVIDVQASEVHQKAIINRAVLAGRIRDEFLETG